MTAVTPEVLLRAYAAGVFPMAESAHDSALYWVQPDERGIFPLKSFHIPRSLRKTVRQQPFDIRVDSAFRDVIMACAAERPERPETWINKRIVSLYTSLHQMGHAHSVEAWQEGKLVGGLYGVKLGAVFFGESMFSLVPEASKVSLVHLVARLNSGGFRLLDTQFTNPHLLQFGAIGVPKAQYMDMLEDARDGEADFHAFMQDGDAAAVLDYAQSPVPDAY